MEFEIGHTYQCDFVVDTGPLGKHQVVGAIMLDTANTFHGAGQLIGDDFKFAKWKVKSGKEISFANGELKGNVAMFTVPGRSLSAKVKLKLSDDGTFTGVASAAGILKAKITGSVLLG